MNQFKICFIFLVIVNGSMSESSSSSLEEADIYTQAVAGIGLAGVGIHQMVTGEPKRKRQIDRLKGDIEVKSFSDLLKSRVISDSTEQLRANADKMENRLETFFNSMKHNINELRKSIRFFVQNQDIKARRLRERLGMPSDNKDKGSEANSNRLRQRKLLRQRRSTSGVSISLGSQRHLKNYQKLKFDRTKLHGNKSRVKFSL